MMRSTKLFLGSALLALAVFASPTRASAQQEYVVYSLGAFNGDGLSPNSGLYVDSNGRLFGTTVNGGTNGNGTAFALTYISIFRSYQEQILYNFCTPPNFTGGCLPFASLTSDAAGNLYGTTPYSNNSFGNGGVAFELTPGSGGLYTGNTLQVRPEDRRSVYHFHEQHSIHDSASWQGGDFSRPILAWADWITGSAHPSEKTCQGWKRNRLQLSVTRHCSATLEKESGITSVQSQ